MTSVLSHVGFVVAHYPQMPTCVRNGECTGSIFSANAAVSEKRGQYLKSGTLLVAYYAQKPPPITLPELACATI